MSRTSHVIVADRGSFKAYQVNETPTRGLSLQLAQAFNLTDAHGRYDSKLTDEAGQFPVADGRGSRHASSIAERTALELETDRRICKQLSSEICKFVEKEQGGWSFAAPSAIHGTIVESLPQSVRGRLVEQVKSDLVKIEPSRLGSHFESLRGA
jgi:Protein required for attachment to host cells